MLKKAGLYLKVLYRGEIFKKIEYKVKDVIGYFYIRNKVQNRKKSNSLYDIDIKINKNENSDLKEEKYTIFNNKYDYNEIAEKLNTDEKFWRKIKLSEYKDIKIEWEYNRLQILLPLVIKYLNTQNNEYKKQIENILDCWEKNNKFEYTLNWNSNLEVAIRAINIALSLMILQDEEFNIKYSRLLYLHAKHIYSEINYSNCCIPNNHVIGEAISLLVLSRVIDTKENKEWYKKSIKIITKYIDIIDDDGVSKENSFSYQFFVTKMYILALCFIKEKSLFEKLNDKIIKSLNVLKYTIINDNDILNYGDNDNGFVYSIYMEYNIGKDIEEYYNLFFKNKFDNETNIYIKIFEAFNTKRKIIFGKESNKPYIITNNIFIYNKNNNILFFNAKDIKGHAHNDSLAIALAVDGKWIFYDSGTYSYNKSKEERKYFTSRESHSTIQLEQKNAILVGTFRWFNKNKSYISYFEDNKKQIEIEGIIEKCAIRKLIVNNNEIIIEDESLEKNHNITTNWIINKEFDIYNKKIENNQVRVLFEDKTYLTNKDVQISKKYLEKEKAILLKATVYNNDKKMKTKIFFKEK